MDTRAVVQHHMDALEAGDLDGVLSDYTDDSVIVTAAGNARGPAELRTFFRNLIDGLLPPGGHTFTLDEFLVADDVALIAWRLETDAVAIPFGTDTFVVRDGKIVTQTAAFRMEPKS
jgi:ketosteroid isomerase-like protein